MLIMKFIWEKWNIGRGTSICCKSPAIFSIWSTELQKEQVVKEEWLNRWLDNILYQFSSVPLFILLIDRIFCEYCVRYHLSVSNCVPIVFFSKAIERVIEKVRHDRRWIWIKHEHYFTFLYGSVGYWIIAHWLSHEL
jgi:hypothetical protein